MEKFSTARGTVMGWAPGPGVIALSALGARATCAPATLKAPSFIAVCLWKRSLRSVPPYDCPRTQATKIADAYSGGPSSGVRWAHAIGEQPTGPRLRRGRG